MKILNLKIENILSIESADIDFGESGLVLVEGFDFDTGRANGAGKSAIFNALAFGIYDKVPRKITKSEIVRKGCKSGSSTVTINTSSGVYKVKRSRPIAVEFYKDDELIDITQEEFESKIGLSYSQFLTTMYNAQDSSERFISLNDRAKKDFLLKIMNLGSFNLYKKNITEKLKTLSQKKEILETRLEGFKSNIGIYKSQLVDVASIDSEIESLNLKINDLNDTLPALAAVSKPDTSKYDPIEAQIRDKYNAIQSARVMKSNKSTELNRLINLKHSKPDTECPVCSSDLNIINGKAHKVDNNNAADDQINILSKEIKSLEDQISKSEELDALRLKVNERKNEDEREYNSAQLSIVQTNNNINNIKQNILALEFNKNKNQEIKLKMKEILDNVKPLTDEIKTTTEEIELLETVGMFFDPSGAPAYIMDSIVDAFNDSVTDHINNIWPNASYSLQTYKENKDKSITSKFSETLMINGKPTSIGSLSGGELRALSLAIDFAIVDVLNGKFSINLNPIILDEPFNGLDTAGKEMVIELLEKISIDKEIWVVDHASEAQSLFNRTVKVEKKAGISRIKLQ